MPLYEFKCLTCGNEEEHICSVNETVWCSCGAMMWRKISAPAGFTFPGDELDRRFPNARIRDHVVANSDLGARRRAKYAKSKA